MSCYVSILFVWWQKNRFYNNSCTQQIYNGILKQHKIMSSKLGTLWKNTGGCAEHYRCATYYFVFNVVTILLCYYRPWCKCTCTWHIGILWLQRRLQKVSMSVNGKCATAKFKRVRQADINAICNFYPRCLFSPIISKTLI